MKVFFGCPQFLGQLIAVPLYECLFALFAQVCALLNGQCRQCVFAVSLLKPEESPVGIRAEGAGAQFFQLCQGIAQRRQLIARILRSGWVESGLQDLQ